MTCRYSNTNWLDVLYMSVRRTKGGVADAARFLTERRGKSIHPESLRAKLKGDDDAISVEMAELLSEWMEEKEGGAEYANDWIQALAGSRNMAIDNVPAAPANGWPCEITALQSKVMNVAALAGKVAGTTAASLEDGDLSAAEVDALVEDLRDLRTMAHRAERNAVRTQKAKK
ncbi:hypothetical protein EYW45_00260 [Achromobacter sp. KS-M25]|nr:hypothetical protein [Achromobacter aestuarii]